MHLQDAGWLKPNSSIKTVAIIMKASQNVRIRNPASMLRPSLPIGAPGRIMSVDKGAYLVWLLEEASSNRIEMEVPLRMMGVLFQPAQHTIFMH